ncbi:MAG: hypothetical protein ACR2OB_01925 [Solirubrobacteraceae bacterium]
MSALLAVEGHGDIDSVTASAEQVRAVAQPSLRKSSSDVDWFIRVLDEDNDIALAVDAERIGDHGGLGGLDRGGILLALLVKVDPHVHGLSSMTVNYSAKVDIIKTNARMRIALLLEGDARTGQLQQPCDSLSQLLGPHRRALPNPTDKPSAHEDREVKAGDGAHSASVVNAF